MHTIPPFATGTLSRVQYCTQESLDKGTVQPERKRALQIVHHLAGDSSSSSNRYCTTITIGSLRPIFAAIRPRAPRLLFLAQRMWQGIKDHREGVGYFSDPIGKPTIWKYWGTLGRFSVGSLLNNEKQPTVEGLEAIKNSPVPDSGDGVTVTLSERNRQHVAPRGVILIFLQGCTPFALCPFRWVGRPSGRETSASRRVSVGWLLLREAQHVNK